MEPPRVSIHRAHRRGPASRRAAGARPAAASDAVAGIDAAGHRAAGFIVPPRAPSGRRIDAAAAGIAAAGGSPWPPRAWIRCRHRRGRGRIEAGADIEAAAGSLDFWRAIGRAGGRPSDAPRSPHRRDRGMRADRGSRRPAGALPGRRDGPGRYMPRPGTLLLGAGAASVGAAAHARRGASAGLPGIRVKLCEVRAGEGPAGERPMARRVAAVIRRLASEPARSETASFMCVAVVHA
jgi:hypothetical protein